MARKKSGSNYFVNLLNGMAYGFFSSLIIGVILKQFGQLLHIEELVLWGTYASYLMGPAIGVGVAYVSGATGLNLIAAAIAGSIGAGTFNSGIASGDAVSAFLAAWAAVELTKFVQGKTPVDILITPLSSIIIAGVIAKFVGPYISAFVREIGSFINQMTTQQPFVMSIAVAVLMGMALTAPISSAAIAISLGLSGLAAGAALAGCCAQMIGFMMMSIDDNDIGNIIAVGIGTSMLQFKNIVKNPLTWIPPIIASVITGPIAVLVFKLQCGPTGAGMGTAGFVGILNCIEVMGNDYWIPVLITCIILPLIITYSIYRVFRIAKWIKKGDLQISRL